MELRWIDWNLKHIGEHGVKPEDAEAVVVNAARPFPMQSGKGKYLVWGRGSRGRLLQVVYLVEDQDVVFVIHSRELTWREKVRYRRMQRQ